MSVVYAVYSVAESTHNYEVYYYTDHSQVSMFTFHTESGLKLDWCTLVYRQYNYR